MKKIAGTLKLDQAQFRELEAFSKFGSDLDAATKAVLDKGRKNVEILKQDQYAPMPVEKQVAIIYCGTQGLLSDIPVEQVKEFETEFLEYMELKHKDTLSELAQGEESLKNKEITEVLYGSGMGGVANIDEIKSQIVAEEEIIFKSRSTNPRLNKLIKHIKEKEKEMREYIIVPSNYASKVREIKNKEKDKNEMEDGLTKAKRRMDHIENLLEACEPFLNIKNDRSALDRISIPPNLPQDMKSTYDDATKEMNRLRKELNHLGNEIEDLERKRDAI